MKKSVEGRPEREMNPFQLPTTLVGWCLFTCDRYARSSHSACRVSVHSGEPFLCLAQGIDRYLRSASMAYNSLNTSGRSLGFRSSTL
jgi:hypothetical protein